MLYLLKLRFFFLAYKFTNTHGYIPTQHIVIYIQYIPNQLTKPRLYQTKWYFHSQHTIPKATCAVNAMHYLGSASLTLYMRHWIHYDIAIGSLSGDNESDHMN